jgi:alkanesulfonate monooxygenase SsuD/methylene tetrahydromethanopterin reductase-like flavin-dependent oxidoreductase (luciferase family)
MRERVLAMKEIWTHHEATFHGELVSFDAIWADPKPLQNPHPPILVGGNGPTVLDRVLEYGDAWMPNYRENLPDRIRVLRERAGRHVPVVVMGPPVSPAPLESCAEAGVDRVLFWLPSAGHAFVAETLDRVERAMGELNGTE